MDLQQAITEIKKGITEIFLDEELLPNLEYIGEDLNIKHKPKYCGTKNGKSWFVIKYKTKTINIYA